MNKPMMIAIVLTGLAAAPALAQMGTPMGRGTPSSPPEQTHNGGMQSGGMRAGTGHDDMGRGGMDRGGRGHDSASGMDHRGPMDDGHAGMGMNGDRDMGPPSHWRGKKMAWSTHMKRCQQRYRSYDPHSDMYMLRHGKKARCRL